MKISIAFWCIHLLAVALVFVRLLQCKARHLSKINERTKRVVKGYCWQSLEGMNLVNTFGWFNKQVSGSKWAIEFECADARDVDIC